MNTLKRIIGLCFVFALLCSCGSKTSPVNSSNNTVTDPANYVFFDGETCYVKTKYTDKTDLVIVVGPGGGNGLPDIRQVYTVANRKKLNDNLTLAKDVIYKHDTDIIGPHVLAAVSNADGDAPYAEYFTGGNHQTNNSGTGGAVTARYDDFLVLCDGQDVSHSAFGDQIEISWNNYIQGYNTSKSDGTGRALLEESVCLQICGTKISLSITHTALEDIIRKTYYGPQMISGAYGQLRYGDDEDIFSAAASGNCGEEDCRVIRLFSAAGDLLEMGIEPGGLGDFHLNQTDHSAFHEDYGKCYFNLIRNTEFLQRQGECTTVNAYYLFGFASK